jgi:hypothetical protein
MADARALFTSLLHPLMDPASGLLRVYQVMNGH